MSHTISLLDGNGINAGQGQEGKHECGWNCIQSNNQECRDWEIECIKKTNKETDDRILEEYAIYADYLTKHEMLELSELEHGKPSYKKRERIATLYDKVNLEEVNQKLEMKLVIMKQESKKNHASYQLGAREFAFTYSPKWMSDSEARLEMQTAINKLLKYYADEIITLRAVGEVGSNGLSHIHCFYKLQGGLKITDKNFKRAWKYWNPKKPQGKGFEGGHHQTVKIEADFLGYIDKDIETAWLDVARPLPK